MTTIPNEDLRADAAPTPPEKKGWPKRLWAWFQSLSRGWQAAIVVGLIALTIVSALTDDTQTTAPAPVKAKPVPQVVDVRGLTLPQARKALKADGYKADPKSTDTVMGIYIEQNFTVCSQELPKGHLVPIKVAKYGCED
jgi:hypothetical protein